MIDLVKISSPVTAEILTDLSTWGCEKCRFRYQCPDAYTLEVRDGCEYFIRDRGIYD